jgi:hypothetical protein
MRRSLIISMSAIRRMAAGLTIRFTAQYSSSANCSDSFAKAPWYVAFRSSCGFERKSEFV